MPRKTQFKTNIVERYKNKESSYQISKNEGCSYNTVLRELKRRGVDTGLMFWTKKEIEKLKKLYPITFKEGLLKEFSNRKEKSIGGMAKKLGLKKRECKKNCKDCGEEFITRFGKEFCLKCVKKQWEHNNLEKVNKRKKQWLQKNPEYLIQYVKRPEVKMRIYRYFKQLRKENPKYRLDCNMGIAIYQALKEKKAGRHWELFVDYTLKDLIKHLERQFDKNMTWGNYGSYWHVDHIKPRSLFKYIFPKDTEFKKCWALENLQPLERIANFKKGNTFTL